MKKYLQIELLEGGKFNILQIIKIYMFNINKRFLFLLRFLFWSKENKIPFLTGYLNRKITRTFGCHIAGNAKIGVGAKFPHPNGIVIGNGTVIGKNCTIFQQVTFGGKIIGDAQKGNYPKIDDNVVIFAGAKIIGNINIGKNAVVGANSVVTKDVPSFSVVAGIPARIIKINQEQRF